MVIKVCGRHGWRERGSDLSDLECPGCQREDDEKIDDNPFEEMETL